MSTNTASFREQVETAIAFNKSPLAFLQKNAKNNLGYSKFKVGPVNFIHVFSPSIVKHILQTNSINYGRSKENDAAKALIGKGVAVLEGESWMRQRKLIQPLFHKQYIAEFSKNIVACTKELLSRWGGEQSGVLDLYAEMTSLSLHSICRTLFGTGIEKQLPEIDRLVSKLIGLSKSMQQVLTPTSANETSPVKDCNELLRKIVADIISSKENSGSAELTLLNMLQQTEDADTKEKMTEEQLIDETVTLLLSGHATTAGSLTFALHLLFSHSSVYENFFEEVKRLNGQPPTHEDLRKLPYTLQIINETLRLYPPLWNLTREALNDEEIEGLQVHAGNTILISPYVLHNSPRFWENPELFYPERFNNPELISKGVFFPFGKGPRMCIGSSFALMNLTISIVTIAQKFKLKIINPARPELEELIVLQPKGSIPVELIKL